MNCFLKGDKAETVRKPKHVSGSISKVVYQDENDEDLSKYDVTSSTGL